VNRPMTRVTARGLWARKRRLSGLLAAVFLGIAFLTGTLGLSATMSSAISSAFTTAYQGTDGGFRVDATLPVPDNSVHRQAGIRS